MDQQQEQGQGIKVRLTLGTALIDLEVPRQDLVPVISELTEEFTKRGLLPKVNQQA